jgi:hypothetical protein
MKRAGPQLSVPKDTGNRIGPRLLDFFLFAHVGAKTLSIRTWQIKIYLRQGIHNNMNRSGHCLANEGDRFMTVHDVTIDKLRQLPEPLAEEVNDFIDFILMRHDSIRWQLWINFSEGIELSESDFGDYLFNLEDYENRLASGEIKW